MNRISCLALTILLIAAVSIPGWASVVPKDLSTVPQMGLQFKFKPVRMPLEEEPFTGEGTVVAMKYEPWLGSAMCVAQIKQADGKAFNAFVPEYKEVPLVRTSQGAMICEILSNAMRSGNKVKVEGMKTQWGGGKLGKMRVNHIRYYNGAVDDETEDLPNEGVGDDIDCWGFCTVIGTLVSVDANMRKWTEWDLAYQEQSVMCRAIMRLPDDRIVKFSVADGGDMEKYLKDDPGKLKDLGEDPIKVNDQLEKAQSEEYDENPISCVIRLGVVKHAFEGPPPLYLDGFMDDLVEDEESYVSYARSRINSVVGCEGFVDAVAAGDRVAVFGHFSSKGLGSAAYIIRYPAVAAEAEAEAESEVEETSAEPEEQYVFPGHIEAYGLDTDWAVGQSAF